MSDLKLDPKEVEYLLTPKAIRDRAREVYDFSKAGKGHFVINDERFDKTVKYVLATIQRNYPDEKIPFHSRWGHFRPAKSIAPRNLKK